MLAAVYHGPGDLRVEEVGVPKIGAGEILVKVLSASICGTDLRIYHGSHRMYAPGTVRIPGHEVVGTIAEIGEGLVGFTRGERVFVAPNMGCGHCAQCVSGNNNLCANYGAIGVTMDGGFAEYMRVPAKSVQQGNVIQVSESVDPAVAALMEPFACVLRGQNALHMQPGETVLVIGAGPIGVMHTKLAKARGAGRVIVSEPVADRAAQARRMGADRAVNPLEEDLKAAIAEESQGRRRGRGDRGGAGTRGAGERPGAGSHRRADQLLRRAAERPPDHPIRFEPGALQRAGDHRNDGLQHGGLLAGDPHGEFRADRPERPGQPALSAARSRRRVCGGGRP